MKKLILIALVFILASCKLNPREVVIVSSVNEKAKIDSAYNAGLKDCQQRR